MAATPEPTDHTPAELAGAWVDAAVWLAWWEAERWERASWEAQASAAWQLGWAGRWMQRDADDGR